jgi:hypothetical protein
VLLMASLYASVRAQASEKHEIILIYHTDT